MAQSSKRLPAMRETWVQSLGWEDPPGEGNGNPLQYSCLENPMDRGAWWATVHGVAKSRTRLSHFTSLHFTLACRSGLQKTLLFLLESSRSGLNFWPETCFPSLCGELHSRSERLETAIGLCSWILILLDDPITVILVKTDVVSLCLVLLSAPCFPFV